MGKWHIICTRKGWERKTEKALLERGFQSYCPLLTARRKWSDRVKTVSSPLFDCHLFVKATEEQRSAVRLTPGVKNFVYTNGRPATVRKRELDVLRQMLGSGIPVEVFLVGDPLKTGLPNEGARMKKAHIVLGDFGYEVRSVAPKPKTVAAPTENI